MIYILRPRERGKTIQLRKEQKKMNDAKLNYKKKCKSRKVDFYLHEEDLYKFSKQINFNKFVKDMLKVASKMGKVVLSKWPNNETKERVKH